MSAAFTLGLDPEVEAPQAHESDIMVFRTAIVDDEPLARRRLRRLLASFPGVETAGEAGDATAAVEMVRTAVPEILLLDVQMPEVDGFGILDRLTPPRPVVIFMTAFEPFVVQALDVHGVDYVLKPVSRALLGEALERARTRLASRPADRDEVLAKLTAYVALRRPWLERLPVRANGRVRLVDVSSIDWVEAADNYVIVHSGRDTHILRETLAHLAASLNPAQFARIHRSPVVRIDRIAKLETALRGDYAATLTDGTRLVLSRTHRAEFEKVTGRRL